MLSTSTARFLTTLQLATLTLMVEYRASRTVELLEGYLRSRGVMPKVAFRSEDNSTVQAMVAAGIGVAIAPLLAVDQANQQVTVVELGEAIPARILVAVWHRGRHRTQPAISFVETAAQVAREVERANDDYLARHAGQGAARRRDPDAQRRAPRPSGESDA